NSGEHSDSTTPESVISRLSCSQPGGSHLFSIEATALHLANCGQCELWTVRTVDGRDVQL
ncbi:MAG: hypothetical protein AAEJ47_01680, partial [Planctomycetota bacterium]